MFTSFYDRAERYERVIQEWLKSALMEEETAC